MTNHSLSSFVLSCNFLSRIHFLLALNISLFHFFFFFFFFSGFFSFISLNARSASGIVRTAMASSNGDKRAPCLSKRRSNALHPSSARHSFVRLLLLLPQLPLQQVEPLELACSVSVSAFVRCRSKARLSSRDLHESQPSRSFARRFSPASKSN